MLNWLAISTRRDLAPVVSLLSTYLSQDASVPTVDNNWQVTSTVETHSVCGHIILCLYGAPTYSLEKP